jgi:hypothetical protein
MMMILKGILIMLIIAFFCIALLKFTDALPEAGFFLFVSIGFGVVYVLVRNK